MGGLTSPSGGGDEGPCPVTSCKCFTIARASAISISASLGLCSRFHHLLIADKHTHHELNQVHHFKILSISGQSDGRQHWTNIVSEGSSQPASIT